MRTRAFEQVDVFTATPYLGNPLAVVLDAEGLPCDDMQRFARWTALSETTFLLPPTPEAAAQGAHYRVRIFTPGGELPFAGHPTLGSCHAWLQAPSGQAAVAAQADSAELLQECGVGLVRIRRAGERLAFAAPPLRRSLPAPEVLPAVAAALGLVPENILASQWLDNGPTWLGLLVDDAQRLLGLEPDHQALKRLGIKVGLAHIQPAPADIDLEASERPAPGISTAPQVQVRAFAAPIGVNEDPVTGSLNASLAQWLMAEGRVASHYTATQGTCLGRHGQVHLAQDATGQVWVGGDCVTCITGLVQI